MRKAAAVLIVWLVLSVPNTALCEEEPERSNWSGNANIFMGVKLLEKQDWEPVDKPAEAGLMLDIKHARIPVSFAVDLLCSRDEERLGVSILDVGAFGSTSTSRICELNIGLRKIMHVFGNVRPFIGGGLGVVNAEITTHMLGVEVSDDDYSYGAWVDVGCYVTLKEHLNLGLDARWSKYRVDLLDINGDAGGWHFGGLVGYHW